MKKKTKNRLQNALMLLLIAAMAAAAVLAVGSFRGWFARGGSWTASSVSGSAFLRRDGVSYSLRQGAALKSGDSVETAGGGTAVLAFRDGGTVTLGERTEVSFPDAEKNAAEVLSGEVFAETAGKTVSLAAEGLTAETADGVLGVSAPAGTANVYVFAGSAALSGSGVPDGSSADAGGAATFLPASGTFSVAGLKAESLSGFFLKMLRAAGESRALCFTAEELDAAEAPRTQTTAAAETETSGTAADTAAAPAAETTADAGTGGDTAAPQAAAGQTESGGAAAPQETETASKTHTCTVTVVCSTILDHMGDLKEGKESFVPSDGVILSGAEVTFTDGETAFDALKRACDAYGIQLEYAWTPGYNSYYIEGINNLYEFDCGTQSGWVFKVNGWFPNYGCSGYTLEDGDAVTFCYTCSGYGADVGG